MAEEKERNTINIYTNLLSGYYSACVCRLWHGKHTTHYVQYKTRPTKAVVSPASSHFLPIFTPNKQTKERERDSKRILASYVRYWLLMLIRSSSTKMNRPQINTY